MGRAPAPGDTLSAARVPPSMRDPMRMPTAVFVIAGFALILLGGFFLFGGGYPGQRDVLRVGSLEVSTEHKQTVSPWIATAAILGGVALLFTTVRNKA